MKKLLTIAVVTMCAALVQATSVDWTFDGDVLASNGSDYANGTAWVVYMGSSDDLSPITVDGSGNISVGDDYSITATANVSDGLVNDGLGITSTSTANGNYVLFAAYEGSDGYYYGHSDVTAVSGLVDDNTVSQVVSFGSSAMTLSTPAEAVPEPTSLALLALGLAALGLKRKVA